MPRQQQQKKKKTRKASRTRDGHPDIPGDQLYYSGPIKSLGGDRNNTDTELVTLHEVSSTMFTTSAGGVMNINLLMSPATAQDWSTWASNYREARLVGCRLEYKPNDRYSKTTTVTKPAIAAADHSTASKSISSYSDIIDLSSARDVSLDDFWSVEWRMDGADEGQFLDVGGVSSRGHIYVFSTGLSVSTNYGLGVIYWLVQFRGRG